MSRAAAASRSTGTERSRSARAAGGYFARSELPLTSLAFVLPFIIIYEIGTLYSSSDSVGHTEQRIIAFNLLQEFFGWFGATGRLLPPFTVVLILLCCHVARNDAWKVELWHLGVMFVEAAVLAVPLMAIGFVATHYLQQYLPLFAVSKRLASLVVLSIGAGVYEELVFRLIAFTALSFLFVDLLGMRRSAAGLLMVVTSALLFALYHYLGTESFNVRTFTFRTVAGCYFGTVFLFRGFGITAGAHAAYDIFVVSLRAAL